MSERFRFPIPPDADLFDPYSLEPVDWAPPGFRCILRGQDGRAFRNDTQGLAVIVSGAVESDGKRWVHLSVSRKSRIPSYEDLNRTRKLFLGEDVKAVQVFPKKDRYVNLNPTVLHLFVCLDEDGLPEFSGWTRGGIRTL